ncbi:MAG TPA: PQQ-binding-like beta-propeller repeat protein, partial [Candidatus Baltobacteraceae bacterium]|nr:PQQ-binding-like beta-propeller repeat protein [Candidatus Baltobacteraceae bacterium]
MSMSQILDGADGRIYLAASYPNGVFALDPTNGTVLWRHLFATYDGAFSDCPLAFDGKTLYAMYVRQIRPMQLAFRPYLRPAVQHVYAIAKNGTVRWDIKLPNVRGIIPAKNEAAIPLIYAGTLYVGSGLAPVLTALDPGTGKVRWQARLRGIMQSGMSAVNGVIYLADSAGYLWAIDARTGLTIGSVKTDMRVNVASPIILNESLVIGSRNGVVAAVPLRAIRESLQVAGVTAAPPDLRELLLLGI